MINENVQKLKNTIRAGRAMHGYLVTSADCDETAPEGEPSSTAELLRPVSYTHLTLPTIA